MALAAIIIVIIIIVIVGVIILTRRKKHTTTYSRDTNIEVFDTDNDTSDKNAADMILRLNASIKKLIIYLKKKYPNDIRVKTLIREYDNDDLKESSSTYIINKGDKIHIKVRNNGDVIAYNLLMFVVLHELAHMICPSYIKGHHHGPEFYKYNRWLLRNAIKCGIYQYHNYELYPLIYGNHLINKNII